MKKIILLVFGFSHITFVYSQADMNSQWTWMKGDNITGQLGVYGTMGIAASTNKPGSRQGAASWTDINGNLWLFGGNMTPSGGGIARLNDLWKYNPSTNQWTWVKGSNMINEYGVYGVKGVSSSANQPGARGYSSYWVDNSGDFWLFGGWGRANSGLPSNLNDLWKYNPSANEWTWVKGDSIYNVNGVYGTQGVSSGANQPGGRQYSYSWADNSGNLWLLGGNGRNASTSGYLNDLWKFNISTNEWTWLKGDNVAVNVLGIYGTLGTSSAANKPGSRAYGFTWTANDGKLWMFGGFGYDAFTSTTKYLNDLWKYDPATNQWTWMKGSNIGNQNPLFGVMGVASASNVPNGRDEGFTWKDNSGNFWLMGGHGQTPNYGTLNDVWHYNLTTNEWTWVKGDTISSQNGSYGTLGVQNINNKPGARFNGVSWKDAFGNFWLFGGNGYATNGIPANMSDLWKLGPFFLPPLQICPGSNNTLPSSITGASYQWQVSTDSINYTNITDNSNYSGSNTVNLQINNTPSSWYGYRYRCMVNGNSSNVFTIIFVNNWNGSVSSVWEDPANWSCGSAPDSNTDVNITSGTVVINSNVTIRSLRLGPGVIFTVNPPFTLTVLH